MVLGFSEDFSSNSVLDSSLTNPTSGLFVNSGVSSIITIKNLLDFLPFKDVDISAWSDTKDYSVYLESRNKKDLVIYDDKVYQSIQSGINKQPDTNPLFWLETNYDSLKIKNFMQKVQDRVYSDLNLTNSLINNQYLYELGDSEYDLPNDFSAWVFEAKGSDYISLRINEVCFQALTDQDVNLYVINQGVLLDTLTITPKNGKLVFETLDYEFKGKGKLILAVDSTKVLKGKGYIDSLLYDGMTVATMTGIGDNPQDAKYTYTNTGNGLGFNISVILDSSKYIYNNSRELASLIKATFEYMCYELFENNSNGRGNRTEKILSKDALRFELKDLNFDTVVRRYRKELEKFTKSMDKTYDTQIKQVKKGISVKMSSV